MVNFAKTFSMKYVVSRTLYTNSCCFPERCEHTSLFTLEKVLHALLSIYIF